MAFFETHTTFRIDTWPRFSSRLGLVLVLCALLGVARANADGTSLPPEPCQTGRVRVLPFFEYRAWDDGSTFWALRPFYSKLRERTPDTRVADTLWPLGTFHRDRETAWWRIMLAYGSDNDINRDDAAWKAALFPLWFQGRSRQGEDYWALFPIYGHLPHVLLMDNIDFILFPCYLHYEVNKVDRYYYLWPLLSRTGKEDDTRRTGIFPFYGSAVKRGTDTHRYALWPLCIWSRYNGEENNGYSWMLFPLYGSINRKKEEQTMVIPPFFSYTTTDTAKRWRLPWPLIETLHSKDERKYSFWPLYGTIKRDDERRWYALWPLIEHFNLESRHKRTERSRFFPFYVRERVYRKNSGGGETLESSYLRLWPFYSSETAGDKSHARVLELSLIRYSEAIGRNWAPFWTFYERIEKEHEVKHDAIWGILQHRTSKHGSNEQP